MRSGGGTPQEEAARMTDEQLLFDIETGVSFDVPAGDMQHVIEELIARYKRKSIKLAEYESKVTRKVRQKS